MRLIGVLRHANALWLLPFLIAVDLSMIFLRDDHWVGVWPETAVAAQMPAMFLAMLAAAYAAWTARREERLGLAEQLEASVRPRWQRELLGVASIAAVTVVAYCVGFVVALARTLPQSPPGFSLVPGYWLLGLFPMLAAVGAGWILGKYLPSAIAAVVAGIGGFLAFAYFGEIGGERIVVISGYPDTHVDLFVVLTRVAAAVALCAVAILLPVRKPRSLRGAEQPSYPWARPLVLVPACVVVMISVFALGRAAGPAIAERAAVDPLCRGDQMKLCLWPEHEKYAPVVAEISQRVEALPDIFVREEDVAWEYGLRYRVDRLDDGTVDLGDEEQGSSTFEIFDGSPGAITREIARMISWRGYQGECAREVDEARDVTLRIDSWLEHYLAGGGSPGQIPAGDPEVGEQLQRGFDVANGDLSREEQFEWAEEQVEEYRSICPRDGQS
ncbi:hypothetical protein EF847_11355 [Actinobacteria bacterium YIM 96077]|uniref:Uncharacterized protein n=1 Tax=Phytoactinopolyspora halophila TaxID=1981511 RepID=A0A329QZ06_9ACTN|nr:hypothetical protein [Phytoactinopolyspora halophila]AYY13206.1 hypothetical protein EF847_11355 [Actinobacteria bacterium YIM 96077]RAW17555.1 hypothetical protein DPM12_06065 [Phytoactinopolyspora halophila]